LELSFTGIYLAALETIPGAKTRGLPGLLSRVNFCPFTNYISAFQFGGWRVLMRTIHMGALTWIAGRCVSLSLAPALEFIEQAVRFRNHADDDCGGVVDAAIFIRQFN